MNRYKLSGILFLCLITLFQLTVSAKNPNDKKLDIDIVFIGNSITYGANLENPKQDAPSVVASEILRKKSGINSVQFSNQGHSGFTTLNYLPDSPTFADVIQATKLLHTNQDHILIFSIKLGTNDSAISGPKGAPVSKEGYRKNLKAIIDELFRQFPDAKVILQKPIWYSTNTYNYFPELKSLVKSYSANNKTQVFLGDEKGFNYFRKNYLTDLVAEKGQQGTFYLHPNKKGAAKLAKFWADAIYQIVN
jgi:lysophospholipase L1-like esterase